MSAQDVSAIVGQLRPVFAAAFKRGHMYAELCNGRLVGTCVPTSIERPASIGNVLRVSRRHCSLVLTHAALYGGTDLDPRLAAALRHPYVRAYSMLAPAYIDCPLR